jgi:hypothetical protein
MAVPVLLSKAFYQQLAEYAEEFRLTRAAFVMRAIKHYAKFLRTRDTALGDALGKEEIDIERYKQIQGKLAKDYWANIPEAERKRRMAKAIEARWPKKKK